MSDLGVIFSDETGAERAEEERDAFVDALREVACDHGYDVSSSGPYRNLQKFMAKSLASEILDQLIDPL